MVKPFAAVASVVILVKCKCTMKVSVVTSLVLCCSILTNGGAEFLVDPATELVEIFGDIDDDMLVEDFLEDSTGGSIF